MKSAVCVLPSKILARSTLTGTITRMKVRNEHE